MRDRVIATYANPDYTLIIKVLDNISYEINRDGIVAQTDMTKWYASPNGVQRHIENDIASGYYPKVRKV